MTVSYSLMPVPKWYIADLVGRPLGGGFLSTFSSLDHTQLNPVFQTQELPEIPWPYVSVPNQGGTLGIQFDENGAQGPFYFKFDSSLPNLLYYLEVYDSNGVLQWTIDDFSPATAGGSVITTALNINNLVTNNIMLRNNIGDSPVSATNFMVVAPGAHSGLALTSANAGPDIVFIKNGTGATDNLSFQNFGIGEQFPNGEPTPLNYLRYICSVSGTSETIKCVQFPVTHGVHNIQNQAVTIALFARCVTGNANITINWLQFFGDGPSASPVSLSPVQTFTLTSGWQKLTVSPPGANVPDITGLTVGECHNDGLFLQIQYPFDATTTIDFTKPSLYMGSIIPAVDFTPNDAIESVMYAPRTGYVFPAYDVTAVGGFVRMNDGTIGDLTSGATTRANADTFPLYNLLYNNVTIPSGNTLCIVSGYTGNAINDFVAHRTMQLPASLGRALCAAGAGSGLTSRSLGSIIGAESRILALSEIPNHEHLPTTSQFVINENVPFGGPFTLGSSGNTASNTGGILGYTSQTALSLMQPSSFMNFYIKL